MTACADAPCISLLQSLLFIPSYPDLLYAPPPHVAIAASSLPPLDCPPGSFVDSKTNAAGKALAVFPCCPGSVKGYLMRTQTCRTSLWNMYINQATETLEPEPTRQFCHSQVAGLSSSPFQMYSGGLQRHPNYGQEQNSPTVGIQKTPHSNSHCFCQAFPDATLPPLGFAAHRDQLGPCNPIWMAAAASPLAVVGREA